MEDLAIPLEPFVVARLQRLRRNNSHKLFRIVAAKIMVEEHVAAKELKVKITANGIQYAIAELIKHRLVQQYIDNSGQAWIMIHRSLIDEGLSCRGCKYNKNVICEHKGQKAKVHKCKLKEALCARSYWRCAHNVRMQAGLYNGLRVRVDAMRKTGKESYDRNGEERYANISVEKWKEGEFIAYFNVTFKKMWPNSEYIDTHLVRAFLRKVKTNVKSIKSVKPEHVNTSIKEYILYSMMKCEKDGCTYWTKKWSSLDHVRNFASEHFSSITIEKCGTYGIMCPYWKSGGCELLDGMCNKELRRKVLKRYNR